MENRTETSWMRRLRRMPEEDRLHRIELEEHRAWINMIDGLIASGAVTEEELKVPHGTNPLLNLIREWAEKRRTAIKEEEEADYR